MKRNASGKFVNNWEQETKHRVSLSLTPTAWRSLDQAAQQRGISRSEVIEQFARSLEAADATGSDGENAQIVRLQTQLLELQQQNRLREERLANSPDQAERATEGKVAAVLERITDAFVAFDRHWHYTYVNQAAAQILHKTPEDLVGKHVWNDVFPHLVGGAAYEAMQRAIAEQVPVAWEEFGEPVQCWLEARAYPSAEGLTVYFRDVTDRKQAEVEREQLLRDLETERAQFEAVLRQMPAGVLIAEASSNRLVLANEQAKQIIGYDFEQSYELEDYEPITPFTAFRPEGQQYAPHEYPLPRSLRAGEVVIHEEMELRYEDGKRTVITVSSTPILDKQGQILAAAVVLQDITEHQQTESLLRQQAEDLENQQKWLEAVLNLMPTPTTFIDPETAKVIFANRIANELAGGDLPKHKSLEEYANAYYCTDAQGDRIAIDQMPAVLLARGERLQSVEMNWHTPGGVRATLCWGEIMPAMYGHPAIGIVMFQDVTRLKQIEANLRQAEERLHLALSSAQMVAWDVNLETEQVVCSPNAEEVWGMQVGTADEFRACIHPDDRPLLRQATAEALMGDRVFAQEYRVIAANGEVRWLKGQGQIYLNESGQAVRMAGVSLNISDRKHIEANREALLAELQRKEQQQQFLIELNDAARTLQDSEEIVWQVVSATGKHFNVTRCAYGEIDAAQEHVTVDRDYCDGVVSVVGAHRMDLFGAEIIAELKQGKTIVVDDVDRDPRTAGASAAAFAAIETKSLLCVPLVKRGRFVALLVLHHAMPRPWTADNVAMMERIAEKTWLAVERSRAEADLRESEARLQLALNIGRMGTWEWDMQTDSIRWSARHFTILGFQPDECVPSYERWASRVHPDDLPSAKAKLQQAIDERTEYYQEYRLRWPDGTIRWVESRGQFAYDIQGHPKQSIGAVIDITERKQAEQALHQALQKLNFHVENTPMAVVEWDSDFRVIRWSAGAERILGWQAEEILGKTLTEIPFVYEDDLESVTDVCHRLVYGKEPHIFSYNRNYTKDRAVVHCEWYNSSLKDESGQMTSVLSLVLDVTDRKLAEQEREQLLGRERAARSQAEAAQQQLATIVDTSPVGLALLDSEQRFIAINDALAEINGLPRAYHLGKSIQELFGQTDPAMVEVVRQVYATGQPFISPNLPINVPGRDDHRPGYYNVYYMPTVDSNQRVEGLLASVVDVTERVKLERAQQYLAESSAVLASSLDYQTTLEQVAQLTVPELADWCTVHIVEENGAIDQIAVAHADPAKLEWAEQIRDKYPLDKNAERGAALTLRTGQPDFIPEIPDELLIHAAKDPEHLEILRQVGFSSAMTVALRSQDRIIGAISFISAESGRRYAAADLQLAEELAQRASLAIENAQLYQAAQRDRTKAEAANRIKDEFLAVLSHELRSPLNPILGWVTILRSKQLDAARADQALETIERNAKLQAQLIEDLLDVSRILQGKLTLTVAPVNLVTTIEAAAETVRLAAEAKRIQMQTTLNAIEGQVLGDTNRLQQVIWNLLSNAVKFTPAGGHVSITLEQVDTYAQIRVSDTGKGIHPDFLPHVFDYFRQEDGTTTRQFGGLGLGLAIVRQLTELHGGLVSADSPGQDLGATFTVRLPLTLVRQNQPSPVKPLDKATDLTGLQILVVDDEADMRELASFILTQAGAQVATAASAMQALSRLNQSVPDLLLCDVGMPEMNGYALIQQIRQRRPDQGGNLPAIALTAYAGEINQQHALDAGFQLHLAKPIEPDRLVRTIATLVKPPPPEC
ncbi:PAS domain S-box protein [Phormidium tenue]|uniref:Circadian input-output histidine kinase CikA n=1 Tax=Phormidium tenue NIES-30 TaxID=549789 RepID=A0A1U7J3A2_9CYAN|nr:PAS domain S-box protein [Phormidium tenue]MBD2233140.1 PAS domain S-box protein [Phormidium tenue FACHB-1052]OKH46674.1 histidine kinase [Phormidium tenue NIES-30]